jgi:outer membrane murein-binding lipoprotein Lpp
MAKNNEQISIEQLEFYRNLFQPKDGDSLKTLASGAVKYWPLIGALFLGVWLIISGFNSVDAINNNQQFLIDQNKANIEELTKTVSALAAQQQSANNDFNALRSDISLIKADLIVIKEALK